MIIKTKSRLKSEVCLLIIDDSPTFLEGLQQILMKYPEYGITISAAVRNAQELQGVLQDFEMDVALLSLDLHHDNGWDLFQQIRFQKPNLPILLLNNFDWDVNLAIAYASSAAGFLSRKHPPETFLQSIQNASVGSIFTGEQFARVKEWDEQIGKRLRELSPKEWELFWSIAQGFNYKETAEHFNISKSTIEKHFSNILQKLCLQSRSVLIVFFYSNHLDYFLGASENTRRLLLSKPINAPV